MIKTRRDRTERMMNSEGKSRGEIACLTPAGRGGVAVIRVRQPGGSWLRSHFRPQGRASPDRVRAGWIVSGDERLDEVLLREWGPGDAEVHCHGGAAVAERIIRLAVDSGILRVLPGEAGTWGHRGDRIQQEALALLVEAETDGAARMLADQVEGRLSRRLEEIPTLPPAEALEAVEGLLASAPYGIAATSCPEVWILGPPNAGKSTLLNALVGWERVIVHEAPGTTRDLVREKAAIRGIPVTLIDTPGIREGGAPGEDLAMDRTETAWRDGARAILCLDGSLSPIQRDLLPRLQPDRDILVLTKGDLPAAFGPEEVRGSLAPIRLSALTGDGIDPLRAAILRRLAPGGVPGGGEPVVFTPRQERALSRVREAIEQGSLDEMARQVRQCRWGEDNGDADG